MTRIFYSSMIVRKINQTEISSTLYVEVLFLSSEMMWNHTLQSRLIRTSHLTHWLSS